LAHLQNLDAGIAMLRHRLSLPLGEKGTKRAPGDYRSAAEWFAKSRRLAVLEARRAGVQADWEAGSVHVVRGGKRLANTRHHLAEAQLTEAQWRARWEAARWFLRADGESGKIYGNETRKKKFRQLIHGTPTSKVKARLVNMAAEHGLALVAVDPVYTSTWGAQHWATPLTTGKRAMTRHDAAGIAIARRALGHPVRRRTAPPPHDRSDRAGHRTVQAGPGTPRREEHRLRIPGPRTRSVPPGRGANAVNQHAQHRSGRTAEHETWQQDSLPLSLQERCHPSTSIP
jgi:hypothetical protein